MKKRISATIFLHPTTEQFTRMQATHKAYRDAWMHVSRYAFEQKVCETQTLRAGTYTNLQQTYALHASWTRRIIREVSRAYKALWKKVEDATTQRSDGRSTKRYTLLTQAPLYRNPMLSYRYGRGYTFVGQEYISILMLAGRIHIPYECDRQHVALIQQGAMIGETHLWYDEHHGSFSLRGTLEIEEPSGIGR